MNTIKTNQITPGVRQPFSNRSLEHLQSNYPLLAAAFAGAALAQGNTLLILAGGAVSGTTTITAAAGLALLEGELLEIPSHSAVIGGGELAGWEVIESYRAGDPVVLGNSTTANVHLLRQLRVVSSASPEFAVASTRYFYRTLAGGAVVEAPPTPWAALGSTSAYYRRLRNGMVVFRDFVTGTLPSGSAIHILGTLPVGFRPDGGGVALFTVIDSVGGGLMYVSISPSTGDVAISRFASSAGGSFAVYLSPCAFLAEQ